VIKIETIDEVVLTRRRVCSRRPPLRDPHVAVDDPIPERPEASTSTDRARDDEIAGNLQSSLRVGDADAHLGIAGDAQAFFGAIQDQFI
jgi:hypothetical protein